jgi:hypothetical protein
MTETPRVTWWHVTLGCVLAVLVIGVAARVPRDVAPDSDFAVIDSQVLQTLRGWQPVGAYSRFGAHHPGPLYFQALAPAYLISGYRHLSVELTVALINVAAVIGLWWLIRRHARSQATVVASVVFVGLYLWRMDGLLVSPWNPHVPLMPFALLLVAAAAVVAGAIQLLPLVVLLASFVVQAHMGLVPVTAATAVVTAAVVAIRIIRARRSAAPPVPAIDPAIRRSVIAAGCVAALVWAVPIIDEVRPSGMHNLRELAHFFGTATPYNPRLAGHAFEQLVIAPFSPQLGLEWGGLHIPPTDPAVRATMIAEGIALAVATVMAWRRRHGFEAALGALCLAGSIAGLIAVRRLPEEVHEYTVLWVTVLGVLIWTVIAGELVDWIAGAIRRPAGESRPALAGILLSIASAAVALLAAQQLMSWREKDVRSSPQIETLTSLVRQQLPPRAGARPMILVPQDIWGVATGVVLQLYRGDVLPMVDADWVSMFGTPFAPTAPPDVTVTFAQEEQHLNDVEHRVNYRLLGRAGDVYAYRVDPMPASTVAAGTLAITDYARSLLVPPSRLVDAVVEPAVPAARVGFADTEDYVTVRLPAGAIGVRLWGSPGTVWQLRCATDDRPFQRTGRVTIAEGPSPGRGEAYPTEFPACQLLKIAPAQSGGEYWLTEVQVLISSSK